jgi:hypothetical protein
MEDPAPYIFIRASGLLYPANLNPENAIGMLQSIEHARQKIDSLPETDELDIERLTQAACRPPGAGGEAV